MKKKDVIIVGIFLILASCKAKIKTGNCLAAPSFYNKDETVIYRIISKPGEKQCVTKLETDMMFNGEADYLHPKGQITKWDIACEKLFMDPTIKSLLPEVECPK